MCPLVSSHSRPSNREIRFYRVLPCTSQQVYRVSTSLELFQTAMSNRYAFVYRYIWLRQIFHSPAVVLRPERRRELFFKPTKRRAVCAPRSFERSALLARSPACSRLSSSARFLAALGFEGRTASVRTRGPLTPSSPLPPRSGYSPPSPALSISLPRAADSVRFFFFSLTLKPPARTPLLIRSRSAT